MKNVEAVRERTAMAASALALGTVAAVAGAALWLRALNESAMGSTTGSAGDQAASVAAVLIGVFLATCGGQALWRAATR